MSVELAVAIVGGALKIGSSILSRHAQRSQDKKTIRRQNIELGHKRDYLMGTQALQTRHAWDMFGERSSTAMNQAGRMRDRTEALADLARLNAQRDIQAFGRQMHTQAQISGRQIGQMRVSQAIEQSQARQQAAMSGLRMEGSVGSLEALHRDIGGEQESLARLQMTGQIDAGVSQITQMRETSIQRAEELRQDAVEYITRAEESNALMRMQTEHAIEELDYRTGFLTAQIDRQVKIGEEDLEWLDSWWGGKGLAWLGAGADVTSTAMDSWSWYSQHS